MPRYILTGTPGAGKTVVLRLLERHGYAVVEEAATDVIALETVLGNEQHWTDPSFVDTILTLQRRREQSAPAEETVFFDRAPVCTLALSRHLGFAPSPLLLAEIERITTDRVYAPTVFFIRNLGFVRPTEARRISFADSLDFERTHERTYRELGFDLVDVPRGPVTDRVALIRAAITDR